MRTVSGDLVTLAVEGEFDVIVHGCNCFCKMGAGVAKAIKNAFPEAADADTNTLRGDRRKLGTISTARVRRGEHTIVIVNGYTEHRKVFGDHGSPLARTRKRTFAIEKS